MERDELVREHNESFRNIFGRLGKLETDMAQVIPWKERVDMDLYNHGQDGMKTVLTRFVAAQDAIAKERLLEEKRRNEEEKVRAMESAARDRRIGLWLKVLSIALTVVTLLLGWLGYMQTLHNIHDGLFKAPGVSHSTNNPTLSERSGVSNISPRVAFYEENAR